MEPAQTLLMRPQQAAKFIGISRTAVYGLLQRREIASVKCGAARLIPTAELTAWLDRQLAEQDQ